MATKTYQEAHSRAPWRVFHLGKSYWFKDEKSADAKLDEIKKGAPAGYLTAREVDEYRFCKELLKGTPLITAVRYFNEHNDPADRAILVEKAVERFHAAAESKGTRPKTNAGRHAFLKIFVRRYGKKWLGDIGRSEIESVLSEAIGSAQTPQLTNRNNTLKIIRQFYNWAVDIGIARQNPTLANGSQRAMVFIKTRTSKGFLTIEAMGQMLLEARAMGEDVQAAIALQAFAGIRTEEVSRMNWSDVDFARKRIVIRDDVAKIDGEGRIIDWWPEALDIWLNKPKSMLDRKGRALPILVNVAGRKKELIRTCKSILGFQWTQNALRHSYATYGCAFHQSADRMKLLMGQRDNNVFFTNYRKWVEESDGSFYFSGILCPHAHVFSK